MALLAVLSFVAAACGGGATDAPIAVDLTRESTLDEASGDTDADDGVDEPADEPIDEPADEPEPEPTAAPTPEPVVEERSIEDVAVSTVKIEAEGSYVAVGDVTALSGQWNGTGFIINDEGYVVTNNHVVAGAAFLRVTGAGIDGSVNARVLGVSECSDLAVIDLDGSGYSPLEFRTDPVNPGLSIFAAGYPGGGGGEDTIAARDYTVTGGIVSNTTADGRTPWASVDTVVEHDARIRGGNSGGPLVDEQARVVGINYAGAAEDFNYAIGAQEALPLIEQLQSGNVESFGINGEAYVDPEISGVWVQAVESGSPADRAGMEAGDFIVSMEGVPVGEDGTLASYCDVVRSHAATDVIDIEVVRLGTGEVLEGQLNGAPLAAAFSFANEVAEDTGGSVDPANDYSAYEFISDESDVVGVEVPVEWSDRDGAFNDDFGASIWASTNLAAFAESWDVPGIIVEVNYDLGPGDHNAVLDLWTPNCDPDGRQPFETSDGAFAGVWEFWTNCGGGDTELLTLAASPPDGGLVVRMWVQAVDQRDIAAADQALKTFVAIDQQN